MVEKEIIRVVFSKTEKPEEKPVIRKRVAAYARVSTEHDKQENSLLAQKDYFQKYIKENPMWEFAGLYVDDGISGLSYHNREGFRHMVDDGMSGKFDMIITKSLSRFARNTVDALITIRKLKSVGVAVYFQKENINTLDSNGEFLITLMSSFAEEESRSMSENVTWAYRRRYTKGKYWMPYGFFLGYQKGKNGNIEINENEAKIVRFIYMLALEGRCGDDIRKVLYSYAIPSPGGCYKWERATVMSILTNEKYKGDARLQKRFTVDFLTKKAKVNEGEVPQYYVKGGHPAIIREDAWQEVQTILAGLEQWNHSMGGLTNKIVCGDCGGLYGRKIWHSTTTHDVVWECNNRKAGRTKCRCCHIYDDKLNEAVALAVRYLLKAYPQTFADCNEIWSSLFGSEMPDFGVDIIDNLSFDDSLLRILMESIKVTMNGNLMFRFIDGQTFRYFLRAQTPTGRFGKVGQNKRHCKIDELYRAGYTAKKISDTLGINDNTVRSYLGRKQRRDYDTNK